MQISKDKKVEMGEANPMKNKEEGSIRLNRYERGIRTKKVAIIL